MNNKIVSIACQLSSKAQKILAAINFIFEHSGLGLNGIKLENCNLEDLYFALTAALRTTIAPQWNNTMNTYKKEGAKQVYYFSLEFLMGRMTGNNIANLKIDQELQEVLDYIKNTNPAFENIPDLKNELENMEEDWGLGNGGLGRLAACYLDSGATQRLPLHGMGLWYDYGIFKQNILNGFQVEEPDVWQEKALPWMLKDERNKFIVKVGGFVSNEKGKNDLKGYAGIEMIPFHAPIIGYPKTTLPNINTLTLWRVNSQDNAINFAEIDSGNFHLAYKNVFNPHHLALNSVLYPNDNHTPGKKLRLMQEFVLVSSGLQYIISTFTKNGNNIRDFANKVALQINDTHAALLVPELMRILMNKHDLSWSEAWEITQNSIAYTNHTILEEALEAWDANLVRELLPRQYNIIDELNLNFCNFIRKKYPNNEQKVREMSIIQDGFVRMAHLAIVGGHAINGVAKLHTEIIKNRVLNNFYEVFPEKFINVTNGVTPRRWIKQANPELAEMITGLIGDEWLTDLSQLKKLEAFAEDATVLEKLAEIKANNKTAFAEYVYNHNPIKDDDGKIISKQTINPNSIFDVQAKRLHEYKRQFMNALYILSLYNQLKANPETSFVPRTFFFAAKAAPGYYTAKNIIKFINILAKIINNDPEINDRLNVIFLENYNVSLAEKLIPAADLSEQISTAGLEASGTGNMKFSLNGALTIGTMDGATVEMAETIGKENMFIFGLTADEVNQERSEGYNAWQIYSSFPEVKKIIEQMKQGNLPWLTKEDKKILAEMANGLMHNDHYLVLKDLPAYADKQNNVAETYKNTNEWNKRSLLNIARMGYFSSDRAVLEYAENIWNIKPIHPYSSRH